MREGDVEDVVCSVIRDGKIINHVVISHYEVPEEDGLRFKLEDISGNEIDTTTVFNYAVRIADKYLQGYSEGYDDGHEKGYSDGRTAQAPAQVAPGPCRRTFAGYGVHNHPLNQACPQGLYPSGAFGSVDPRARDALLSEDRFHFDQPSDRESVSPASGGGGDRADDEGRPEGEGPSGC